MENGFVHLRVHTNYSLAEGAITTKELAKLCAADGQPAVAMTDTDNMFGALDFAGTMSGSGIQPILGVQMGFERFGDKPAIGKVMREPMPDRLVLIAQNKEGYFNLLKIISRAHMTSEAGSEPKALFEHIEKYSEHVICLTGGPTGPLARLLSDEQVDKAEACLDKLKGIFGDRLYIELQRHGEPLEEQVEPGLIKLAYDHNVPLVATNNCYFPSGKMYEAHDVFICIGQGAVVGQEERWRLTRDHRFKTASEMRGLFADIPEACDNTVAIAKRCSWHVEKIDPILPPFDCGEGRTEVDELRHMSEEGLKGRLEKYVFTEGMTDAEKEEVAQPYWKRLDYELGIINQMGFPGYFLIVADFIQWAKDHEIPVGPGRGSGAGSLVAYALLITDLDPLRFSLLFERFLNPERVSMPDFDVDFCQDRRGEVIEYVQKKYGHDRVAQIITFGKLQAKAAVRDVGRVLSIPYGYVDKICKMIPGDPAKPIPLKEAIDMEPDLRRIAREDPDIDRLLSIAMQIEGLYRNSSTHAAGVVIGDRDLDELVPLYRDPRSDMPVTQFNMKYVENAGLVKFDFLGLKTLTVIIEAVNLMRQRKDVPQDFDISAIDLDDRPAFKLLSAAETVGVFQLESQGMQDVLRGLKPDTLEDIIAVVALYRPGPMDNIPYYIARKHGLEEPDYMHPMLQPILEETYGIMIYQEQVMELAQIMAGYSLGGADLLRRAMGKKIAEEMEKQRSLFVDGAEKNGVGREHASDIFDQVAKFASYGFNKSHAAAYALVAYQTAFLKANYPVEFMAALMTLDMHNTEKLAVFKQEVERLEIEILPPCINNSQVAFSVENHESGGKIRYALAAIRNVGDAAMESLVAEREANGPFKDLTDFASRIDSRAVNKRLLENLVRAGALDCLTTNRKVMFENVDKVIAVAQREMQARNDDQISMFGDETGFAKDAIKLPDERDWVPMEKLTEEFSAIGFYLSAHPLDTFGKSIQRIGIAPIKELPARMRAQNKGAIKLAGTLINAREMISKKNGSKFAFVMFSDPTGSFEVAFWAEAWAAYKEIITAGRPVLLIVAAEMREGQLRIQGQRVEDLEHAVSGAAEGIRIRLNRPDPVPEIRELLESAGKGRGLVTLSSMCGDGRMAEIELEDNYKVGPSLIGAIGAIPGVEFAEEI
ncbi:DNA polymerase III subunit alpha [Thalassospira lucentensis]|uniref:DNA polymerase III subunit alpha n=1 Tax=Thalassospira lucentensis TaxID=168935 RepID=UPI003AA847B0